MRLSLLFLVATFCLTACDPIAFTRYSFVIQPQSGGDCASVSFQTTNTSAIAKLIIETVKKHGARHFNEPNEMSNVVEKPEQGLVILTLSEFGRFSPSETTDAVVAEVIEKIKKQYGGQVVIIQGDVDLPNPALKGGCAKARSPLVPR